MTHAFDLLASPLRRRLLELLLEGEASAGALTQVAEAEFGVSQPAVSQHLRALREGDMVSVRADGRRRVYRVNLGFVAAVDRWVEPFRGALAASPSDPDASVPLEVRLDALATEIARGKRDRRIAAKRAAADAAGASEEARLRQARGAS